jgi:hypothetical protein
MRKALASAALLLVLLAPALGHADASIRQDSCIVFYDGGKQFTRVWFSVINFSLPAPVCGVDLLSEPHPPTPDCIMVATGAPTGWTDNLINAGNATWFANTAADCVPAPGIKEGFSFDLDPGFCCYVVKFFDATGAVILEQEECFCDNFVGVEELPWGGVKRLYQE